MNETTSPRAELIKRLRAESKAATEHLSGVPGVIAGGILHLAGLCEAAANELEMWTVLPAPMICSEATQAPSSGETTFMQIVIGRLTPGERMMYDKEIIACINALNLPRESRSEVEIRVLEGVSDELSLHGHGLASARVEKMIQHLKEERSTSPQEGK